MCPDRETLDAAGLDRSRGKLDGRCSRRVDWVAVPLPAGAPKPWLARTPPDVRAHRSRLEFSRAMVTTTTTSRLPLLEAGEQSVILQTDIRSRFGEAG